MLLSSNGYRVRAASTSSDAMDLIEQCKDHPFSIIVAGYMMPEIKGDRILAAAKTAIPDTRRVLISDSSDLQALADAINLAGIHSCLILPFKDSEFLARINGCCKDYENILRQKNLKRTTKRQNQQLFRLADVFKKKNDLYAERLEKRDKTIRILESRIISAGGSIHEDSSAILKRILKKNNLIPAKDNLPEFFNRITGQMKLIFEKAAFTSRIRLDPVPIEKGRVNPGSEPVADDFTEKILMLALRALENTGNQTAINTEIARQPENFIEPDEYFELDLSQDNTEAMIKMKPGAPAGLTIVHVRQFLENHGIINGIKPDHEIESWLYKAGTEKNPFIIARGIPPKYPKDAEVRYHFPTDFLHAGKIDEDGSIDFQDRGEIPYVDEGAFLAAKVFPEPGSHGTDVFGNEIIVPEPVDKTFAPGPGARISEDGARIYAAVSGQPHLDALGNISVCPEFKINGDLGFETGNVNFEGNVIVNGTVKQGFKVKCSSLTAKEINGAQIDISGDLNVSLGIVDTDLVNVKGCIQAKFIHNSKINAFGDLIIQREIIDSRIYLSGACINENGIILNSVISAKMGIKAGAIGNESATPSRLTMGVDEHLNRIIADFDSRLELHMKTIKELSGEIQELEKEDSELHAFISEQAYIQDRTQIEIRDIEKKLAALKASGNMAAFQKLSANIDTMRKKAAEAEKQIDKGFERQDEIAAGIAQKKKRIRELESMTAELGDTKNRLVEFSAKKTALPEIKVSKHIQAGTRIVSPNCSMILNQSSGRCCIREFARQDKAAGSMVMHEIRIGEYPP